MNRNLLKERLIDPLFALMLQGITPERIALSVAMGITLGLIPVLGTTTILCFAAAAVMRLNVPAIQLVNYLVYPLQLVLLIPFMRIGAWIFAAQPLHLSFSQMVALVRSNPTVAVGQLWTATLHALAVWAILGVLAAPILYRLLTPALRKLARREPAVP